MSSSPSPSPPPPPPEGEGGVDAGVIVAAVLIPTLLLALAAAGYWLRQSRAQRPNGLMAHLQQVRVEAAQAAQAAPDAPAEQPAEQPTVAATAPDRAASLRRLSSRAASSSPSLACSLLPGLPATLPRAVAALFRQPAHVDDDPAVLDREHHFFAHEDVARGAHAPRPHPRHTFTERERTWPCPSHCCLSPALADCAALLSQRRASSIATSSERTPPSSYRPRGDSPSSSETCAHAEP